MIGVVDTNIYLNNSAFKLPASSLYKPIEQQIADISAGKHSPKGMDANMLARNLVDDILAGKRGQLWRGKMASMASWVSMLLPWGIFDGMVAAGTGIGDLARAVNETKV